MPKTAAQFERLWSTYPVSGRLTAGHNEAAERFAELSPIEEAAMANARSCAEMRRPAKSLHRWLRDGRWRNGTLPLTVLPTAAAPAAVGTGSNALASPRDAADLIAIQAGRTPVG